jgi:hypothetical protein
MKKKQQAVEWFYEEIWKQFGFSCSSNILEKAKEMEKQQIIDANIAGQMFIGACPGHYKNDAEDYYKGTFNKD